MSEQLTMEAQPLQTFRKLLTTHKFVFVVFYRGHWCPFCMSYLKTFASFSKDITAAGGIPIIVTAEPLEHLAASRSSSGYEGEAIVDPQNLLAAELKRRGLLEVAISERKGYEHGMAQPAVLVMTSEGKVLQHWAIVPSVMNINGAKDRPSLQEIWENSQAVMNGRPVKHEKFSTEGALKVLRKKLFG